MAQQRYDLRLLAQKTWLLAIVALAMLAPETLAREQHQAPIEGLASQADRPSRDSSLPCEESGPGQIGIVAGYTPGTAASDGSGWILISEVEEGGPADVAGLEPRDLITSINDEQLRFASVLEFLEYYSTICKGAELTLGVKRSTESLEITVTADRMPAERAESLAAAIARMRRSDQSLRPRPANPESTGSSSFP